MTAKLNKIKSNRVGVFKRLKRRSQMKIEQDLAVGLNKLLDRAEARCTSGVYQLNLSQALGGQWFFHIRDEKDGRRILLEMENPEQIRPHSRFDVTVRKVALLSRQVDYERVFTGTETSKIEPRALREWVEQALTDLADVQK
jgi:hypothetical protein